MKGKGKGVAAGTKGRGGDAEYEENDTWAGKGGDERTWRIKTPYQVSKRILRASANLDGSCFSKEQKKMSDTNFLSLKNLRKSVISSESSHVLRRPGVGISEAAASILHGLAVLDEIHEQPEVMLALRSACGDPESPFRATLKALDTSSAREQGQDTKDYATAMEELMGSVKANLEDLDNGATQLAVAAGRTYLMALALKQLLAAASKPSWWAEQVPSGLSDHSALSKWKEDPKNMQKLCKAMGVLLKEKVDRDDDYGENANTAANIFQKKKKIKDNEENDSSEDDTTTGPKGRNAKSKGKKRSASHDASASSDASSQDAKDKKKARKQKDKMAKDEKEKKDKPKRKKKRAKSSSSSSPTPEKESPKQEPETKEERQKSEGNTEPVAAVREPVRAEQKVEEKEASFTLFSPSEIQTFLSACLHKKEEIGGRTDGKYPKSELESVIQKVPAAILPHFPECAHEVKAVLENVGDDVPAPLARKCVIRLLALGTNIEAWLESQAGIGGGASTS